jgi:hypothetical protein
MEKVRLAKEADRVTHNHELESADRGTSQISKRSKARDGHSLSGERGQGNKSEYQKKIERATALTTWRVDGGTSENGKKKKQSEQQALTDWRAQTEEQVRMAKETERATRSHFLESTDRGTSENGKETE